MKRNKIIIVLALIITAFMYAQIPKVWISISCSSYQGFNFETDRQDNVGHVTYMKISSNTVLNNDLTVVNPISYPQTVPVVGVMRDVFWEGGVEDPIQMTFLVSAGNKQAVDDILGWSNTNVDVEFDFNVYSYDPTAHTYFKAFYPVNNAHLLGLINNSGDDHEINISGVPDEEINSPVVYQMTIGIKPHNISQDLLHALSTSQTLVKKWGLASTTPGVPVLVSPADGNNVYDLTPSFSWTNTSSATSYNILVDNNSNFSSPEINQSYSVLTCTPNTDLSAGTYYWKVKAANEYESGIYTLPRTVTLFPPPPLPPGGIIIGPWGPGILINWDDVAGATGYDIYSSDIPYGTYTFEAHVTVSEYQITDVLQRRFYYIVSKN